MTVSTTQNRKTYAGDGVSVVFAFPYKFLAASDLLVYLNGTLQTLTTHYSVGTPSDSGANVTFVTAPANGTSVQVVSDPDQLQAAALPSTGPFPSVTVERMSDKLTLLVQRCRDLISRSFRLADSDVSGASTILPTPSSLKLLGWDVLGTSLQNFSASEVGASIASANWSTATFNGTGAVVDFVLPTDAGVASNCAVSVGGVVQAAGINFSYTQATKTITFLTGAPPIGTNNVVVRYGVAVPQGMVATNAASITGGSIDGTPIGAQNPSTGAFTAVTASAGVSGATVTGTSVLRGTSQLPYVLAQTAIPVILVPNGTVATNGTITLGTALPTIYANAWIRLPAGAVSGGAAGVYYCVFSSTTVGQVYTNFADPSTTAFTPSIPTSPVAATGSNAAYTQTTGAYAGSVNISVPGNSIGPNGSIRLNIRQTNNNSASSKFCAPFYSSSQFGIMSNSSTVTHSIGQCLLANRGITNSQTSSSTALSPYYVTVDSTSTQALMIQMQLQTVATDYIVLEGFTIEVLHKP